MSDKFAYYSAVIEWLARGGATVEEATELIKKLHDKDFEDYTDESLFDLVYGDYHAILNVAPKQRRPIQAEVEEYVASVAPGYILLRDCCASLHLKSKSELSACRLAFTRLCRKGVIEPAGKMSGTYRRVEKKYNVMDWMNAPTNDFKINLPLNLHQMVSLYPSNIVVLAGTSNAGKTALLLNIVKENMEQYPIYYFNSEMGETELRLRLSLFDDTPLSGWKFTPVERSGDYADVITQERAIFIIDFLEVTKDFYEIAGSISAIHQKLKDGIAIIAIQKKSGSDIGRGGEGTLEKARLYLSLDRDAESNICKIVKAKAWKDHNANPNGRVIRYKLVKGSKILPQGGWN